MRFHLYVLYSDSFDKIYVGFTSDLSARLKSHNELSTKGWTVKYRPWKLIYSEEYSNKRTAMKREKELKTALGRKFIREEVLKKYVGLISASWRT